MCPGNIIVVAQCHAGTDNCGLLADAGVAGTGDLAVTHLFGDSLLKLSDAQHTPEHLSLLAVIESHN
jgi:hypothetical protein